MLGSGMGDSSKSHAALVSIKPPRVVHTRSFVLNVRRNYEEIYRRQVPDLWHRVY